MKFHFHFTADSTVKVTFESSKKEVIDLGELYFVDTDGENRPEIVRLLSTILVNSYPLLKVTHEEGWGRL